LSTATPTIKRSDFPEFSRNTGTMTAATANISCGALID
jgi:hypothetical protein